MSKTALDSADKATKNHRRCRHKPRPDCPKCWEARLAEEGLSAEPSGSWRYVHVELDADRASEEESGETIHAQRDIRRKLRGDIRDLGGRPELASVRLESKRTLRDVVDGLGGIFTSQEAVLYAEQVGALNEREAGVLRTLLGQEADSYDYSRAAAVIGVSRQTLRRVLLCLGNRFLRERENDAPDEKPGTVLVVEARRRRRTFLVEREAIGEWRQCYGRLVPTGTEARKLRAIAPAVRHEKMHSVRTNAMDQLLGDLLTVFAVPLATPAGREAARRARVQVHGKHRSDSDWLHNLRWAYRRIRQKRKRKNLPKTPLEVAERLLRNLPCCLGCHRPIPVHCRLNGRLIVRRRRYCNDACRKGHERRSESVVNTVVKRTAKHG